MDWYSFDIGFEYWMMNDRYDEVWPFEYLSSLEVEQRKDWIHIASNVEMFHNHYGIDVEIDDVEYDRIPKSYPLKKSLFMSAIELTLTPAGSLYP